MSEKARTVVFPPGREVRPGERGPDFFLWNEGRDLMYRRAPDGESQKVLTWPEAEPDNEQVVTLSADSTIELNLPSKPWKVASTSSSVIFSNKKSR